MLRADWLNRRHLNGSHTSGCVEVWGNVTDPRRYGQQHVRVLIKRISISLIFTYKSKYLKQSCLQYCHVHSTDADIPAVGGQYFMKMFETWMKLVRFWHHWKMKHFCHMLLLFHEEWVHNFHDSLMATSQPESSLSIASEFDTCSLSQCHMKTASSAKIFKWL